MFAPLNRLSFPAFLGLLFFLFFAFSPALAQVQPIKGENLSFPNVSVEGGEGVSDLTNFIGPFVWAAKLLIGTIAVVFLIYAGYKYVMSRGEEEEAKRAKNQIVYAVIGVIVAWGASVILGALLAESAWEKGLYIENWLSPFIYAVSYLVGLAAIIFLIYAGVKYISSTGDEEAANQAKRQIVYAVLGIIVVSLSLAIVTYFVPALGQPVSKSLLRGGIYSIVSSLLPLVGLAALIFIVYAGVKYISSTGDEEAANQAKRQIVYAVLGLVVVGLSAAIVGLFAPVVPFVGTYPGGLIDGIYLVMNTLLTLVGLAAAIFLVYAGVKYISSTGDEEAANQAKRQIVYALIGLVVIGLSAAIVRLFVYVFPFVGTYRGTVAGGIRLVMNRLLTLVGLAAAIFLVYAGVKYISSTGDEEAANQAKRQIVYALIGLVVIGLSAAIANFILIALGVPSP